MEWLEPWFGVAEMEASYIECFEQQLRREIAPDHRLHGLPVRMIGKNGGNDDVLFLVEDGTGRVAMVHLTWSKQRQAAPWPETHFFESFARWEEEHMKPLHQEFIG